MSENNQTSEINEKQSTLPSWFKTVAILAIVWNCLGLLSFVMHTMMTPEMLASLPEAEQNLMLNYPVWASAAFGAAVIFGLLGSILLIMKKTFSFECYLISLVALVIQDYHWFVMENVIPVLGISSLVMPSLIMIVAIGLLVLSKKGKQNGWFY